MNTASDNDPTLRNWLAEWECWWEKQIVGDQRGWEKQLAELDRDVVNPKPKIVLVDAVLTFRVTQTGKRDFPDLAAHARQVLRILGFDYRNIRSAVVSPDTEDPELHVLSFDLREGAA